jgi:DNA-binding transcriptional regulator WhiA
MANQYTKSKIELEAVHKYLRKQGTLNAIALEFNISRKILTRWVKQSGYNIYPKKQLDYNASLFKIINSEEKAYWLGFIYADGYVSDKDHFELSLGLKDISHLQKLGKFLNKEIKHDHFRCRLSINNKEFVVHLKNHGVVPRKSLVLTFPEILDIQYIPAFIRGYFDGDGCIYYGTKKETTSSQAVSLIGTENMLKTIQKHSKVFVNSLNHDSRHHKNCFSMRINKTQDILKFLDYMYKDSTIHLDRKYEKYCRLRQKCLRLLEGKNGEGCDS